MTANVQRNRVTKDLFLYTTLEGSLPLSWPSIIYMYVTIIFKHLQPHGQSVKLHLEHSWVLETNVCSVHLGHMNQYVLHARIGLKNNRSLFK